MSTVKLKNLNKDYELGETIVHALRDINLELPPAKFISFIGPSGSGKTSLLNLIGCIDKPTSGEVIVNGENPVNLNRTQLSDFRGINIGFIFQSFNLIPVLSIFENVEYPLRIVKKTDKDKRKELVEQILEDVGIIDQKDKVPDKLSGGQRQRVAIARALVMKPKIVIADEPTANLDHKTAGSIMHLMHEMKNKYKTLFIFATHDPKVVDEAEIIYNLEDGKIVNGN